MTTSKALEEIDRLIEAGRDADDVLRGVVTALVEHGGCTWAGILFNEEGELILGPESGSQHPDGRLQVPVSFNGAHVADLVLDDCPDASLAEQIAPLISGYCLVGWDTGGIPWDSAA